MGKHISELITSRRALLGGMAGLPLLNLTACATAPTQVAQSVSFASVVANNSDAVTVPQGYSWRTLIAWGDAMFDSVSATFDPDTLTRAEQEQRWGQNNDMLAMFPAEYAFPPPRDQSRMLMCANLEYFTPSLMFPSVASPTDFTPAQIEACIASTGVAVVMLERDGAGWRVVKDAAPGTGFNRRITPFTPALFSGPAANHPWIRAGGEGYNANETSEGPAGAIRCGTYANCAGGQTPWGTYLTAEENFNYFFHASDANAPALIEARNDPAYVANCRAYTVPMDNPGGHLMPRQYDMSANPHGPSAYGWVVEIDPYDPNWAPHKRTALGRRKGECATTALARDGRVAVYSGDDQANQYVYKFVTNGRFDPNNRLANRDLLDDGVLYVARFEADGSGRWIEMNVDAVNAARGEAARFADQGDVVMRSREAARILGATPMDRPEDVEAILDANGVGLGPVLVVCTNNRTPAAAHPGNPRRDGPTNESGAQTNAAGHIIRIDEAGADAGATTFTWDVFALAGDPNATAPTTPSRSGQPLPISTAINGVTTFTGDRFACPDNVYFDSRYNVWITTDGSDAVFPDCNDGIVVTSTVGDGPRVVKRFLTGPMGSELCGPTMALDERAFFASIQHPGESDVNGVEIDTLRWERGQRPPSSFPDGGDSWPRSAVVVITRDDGGRIGD
ncbi:MAG TPA: PhoX family phosphatase [Verrucomicrobiae bacterium]|nr:PhoX family phosphatase [Verrucomicrobiae bacterium]